MASIALDPRILAAPKADSTSDDIYAFVERLLDWQAFAKELGNTLVITRDAATKLAEDGAFPLPAALRKQMVDVGVIEYDLATLKRLCDLFLNPKVSFQDYVGVDAILYDDSQFAPALPSCPHLPMTTEEAESNAIALAILAHCECKENICGLAVVSSSGKAPVTITAQLHDISHRRVDLANLGDLPAKIEGSVFTSSSLRDFAARADFGKLLSSALDDDQMGICFKLAIYARRLAANWEAEWDELPTVIIGEEFRRRAQHVVERVSGCGANIVATVVDILENTNNDQTHPLRTGDKGGAPPKTLRGYAALRRDVTRKVHIHYWKGPNGRVELAWVSHPHNDFYIPDGTTF